MFIHKGTRSFLVYVNSGAESYGQLRDSHRLSLYSQIYTSVHINCADIMSPYYAFSTI